MSYKFWFCFRKMKRDERKRFRDDMKNFGLLPAERYNYKNVDFSSFQGGSKSNANTTKFQQQKVWFWKKNLKQFVLLIWNIFV